MKSKLSLFLIMFLIWCLFNVFTLWLLEKLRFIHSPSNYFHPAFFITAFVFSAVAAIWPGYFKKALLFILVAELCWLIILWIQGNEHSIGYDYLTMFNASFFALFGYLVSKNAFWIGYGAGWLELPEGMGLLAIELIFIGLSTILVWTIHRGSIRLAEFLTDEDELLIQ
jgi:hypothetical protein